MRPRSTNAHTTLPMIGAVGVLMPPLELRPEVVVDVDALDGG